MVLSEYELFFTGHPNWPDWGENNGGWFDDGWENRWHVNN